MENATDIDQILLDFFLQVLEFVIILDLFQWHFHDFLHFSIYPFQRHVLFPFLWNLVFPSVSQALPLHITEAEIEDITFLLKSGILFTYFDGPIFSKPYQVSAKASPWKDNKCVWQ